MKTFFYLSVLISLFGCSKNNTKFFEDDETNGLSILSDKGYNILSCYVNNSPWVTRNRFRSSTGFTTYELEIVKQRTNTLKDTLIFTWVGSYDQANQYKSLRLHIAVDSSFTYKDFKTEFNNKRIFIDTTVNGYFKTNINTSFVNSNMPRVKGSGVIFFKEASINILTSKLDENIMTGLFSAKIGTTQITNGRFDHALHELPIEF